MMKTKMKLTFTFFLIMLGLSPVHAFECKEVIGQEYFSVGDSDFQYHYHFQKKGEAELKIYFEELDDQDNEKITSESYRGKYSVDAQKLTLEIKVRDELHKIVFDCKDKVQYMNAGAFDQGLIPKKRTPEHHSFSGVPLFKKDSKVIKAYLMKH
jgi:hypothetical protein